MQYVSKDTDWYWLSKIVIEVLYVVSAVTVWIPVQVTIVKMQCAVSLKITYK